MQDRPVARRGAAALGSRATNDTNLRGGRSGLTKVPELPEVCLRGARESDLVRAVNFPRADVALPGARGFRITLRNSMETPIPICLLIKKSTDYFFINGPDSKC